MSLPRWALLKDSPRDSGDEEARALRKRKAQLYNLNKEHNYKRNTEFHPSGNIFIVQHQVVQGAGERQVRGAADRARHAELQRPVPLRRAAAARPGSGGATFVDRYLSNTGFLQKWRIMQQIK